MRIFASALAAWVVLSFPATLPADVGPNAGGTLILHATVPMTFTLDQDDDYCEASGLSECQSAVTRVDQTDPVIAHVIAAFHPSAAPRLAGLVFGLNYGSDLTLGGWGPCGDFELTQPNWPASGSGTAVTWSVAETDPLVEVYWFQAYDEAGRAVRL